MLNKNVTPNLIALLLIALSQFIPGPWDSVVLSVGLFALSGALTNWLAVHMLFERVPGLYGSGVITLHFEEFKAGILRMVREELFSKDNVSRLLKNSSKAEVENSDETDDNAEQKPPLINDVDLEPMLKSIDLDAAYDQLVLTVTESSFGSMLSMVGGEAALQPLREPFKKRMENFLSEAAKSPSIQAAISSQLTKAAGSDRFLAKLEQLLQARLDEMTPEMVKEIMQRMIKNHLGWLVVWGGVFGGIIGLITGLIAL